MAIFRRYMASKIHHIPVTHAEHGYVGSITLDPEIMKMAGIQENEEIQVLNMSSEHRFTTYVIAGLHGSKVCCVNGPAARLAVVGDILILITYILTDEVPPEPKVILFPSQF